MEFGTRVPDIKLKYGYKNQTVIMRVSICYIYAGYRVNEKTKYYSTKRNFVHAFIMPS